MDNPTNQPTTNPAFERFLERTGLADIRREMVTLERERDLLREKLERKAAQLHEAIEILGWSKPAWQE